MVNLADTKLISIEIGCECNLAGEHVKCPISVRKHNKEYGALAVQDIVKVLQEALEGTEKVPSYEKKYYKSYFLSIYNAFFGIIKVSITGGGTYDRATAKNDFKFLYRYLRVSSP